jgi:hypothetical protein
MRVSYLLQRRDRDGITPSSLILDILNFEMDFEPINKLCQLNNFFILIHIYTALGYSGQETK